MRTKTDAFAPETTRLAAWAKALGHPARIAILRLLAEHDTCICGEIVEDLPLAQSTVSQHLRVLKDAGLIQGTIDGPRVCYCLAPEALRAFRDDVDALFGDVLDRANSSGSCC